MNVVFGLGLHQFIFNFCISDFLKVTVKRLYNPERNIWRRYWRFPPSLCCVCVCAPADVHVVGGVLVCAAMSSGGTYRLCQCNSVGDIAAVCTTSSRFSVSKRYFFTGSVSAYGLPPSCCCFHHLLLFSRSVLFLWLYLTALNCCSPGCFSFFFC